MGVVETERGDGVMVVRMNRPERMNALGTELRAALAEAWCEFRDSGDMEVAIFTGTGRAFCAGEDMKESVARGTVGSAAGPRPPVDNPYDAGTLAKPVIAAINGQAMAARRLQPRFCRRSVAHRCNGDGVRLPVQRRAVVRTGFPEPPDRGCGSNPGGARNGPAPVNPASRSAGKHADDDACHAPSCAGRARRAGGAATQPRREGRPYGVAPRLRRKAHAQLQ